MIDKIDIEEARQNSFRKQSEAAARANDAYTAKLLARRATFKAAGGHAYPTHEDAEAGMTLRQHYAGLAMQSLIQAYAATGIFAPTHMPALCQEAIDAADELLHALKETS
jgi:hypothetical protein